MRLTAYAVDLVVLNVMHQHLNKQRLLTVDNKEIT